MFPAATFRGKRAAVFGLARSGTAMIEALRLGGAEVFAWDDSAPAVEKARAAGLPVSNLHELDFATLDALVLSPGVPLTHPEPHWTVLKARHAGIEIIGDTEIFAPRRLYPQGFEVVVVPEATGAAKFPGFDGFEAAFVNYRMIASDVWSTSVAVGKMQSIPGKPAR